MAKQLSKYSRVAAYLEKIYSLLNEAYFENTLSKPVITIQSTPRSYGHVTVGKVWKAKDVSAYELNIGAGTLDRPIEDVTATLLHEMIHIYCLENGIKDTSRGGSYHNKRFYDEASKRDLSIVHHDKYGWTITNSTDNLFNFCLTHSLTEILINRLEPGSLSPIGGTGNISGGSAPPAKSSTRKYACPVCGQSVRATREVNIICGICTQRMLPS